VELGKDGDGGAAQGRFKPWDGDRNVANFRLVCLVVGVKKPPAATSPPATAIPVKARNWRLLRREFIPAPVSLLFLRLATPRSGQASALCFISLG
jgi:hypothetical protein